MNENVNENFDVNPTSGGWDPRLDPSNILIAESVLNKGLTTVSPLFSLHSKYHKDYRTDLYSSSTLGDPTWTSKYFR